MRNLVLILGDQLDQQSSAFEGFDPKQDAVLMIEAHEESAHVWSHKIRTTLFLSAMRHFAKVLEERDWPVIYRQLDIQADPSLAAGLLAVIEKYQPAAIMGVEPGDWRVKEQIENAIKSIANPARSAGKNGQNTLKISMKWQSDTHFLCDLPEFRQWAGKSATLRMEFFYRVMRKKHHILMEGKKGSAEPVGGQWNFDADNRKSFGKAGPQGVPTPRVYAQDSITKDVIKMVNKEFADHPGSLENFNWPVTREQALQALDDFIKLRLPFFGPHQDAMWTNLDFGWHSLLSSSLNLKLLNPLEVIQAAEKCYQAGKVDLPSVEGFIRQILGWREFMRGVYFLDMPGLKEDNFYNHQNALPKWYWSGDTRMNCMKNSIEQTMQNGYSHHIQRLMITGMFGVTAQIKPQALCDWYLAVYVDAVEWVELPNVSGMALFANGGRFTSKPYIASGAYVKRMSNYCQGCKYSPEERSGKDACPMTTLYWNFLDAHEKEFGSNPRTALMVKNLQRMTDAERSAVRTRAKEMLSDLDAL
ncbi:MAG: cryptochrome/photolyase family protein [Burkholderiales bacterium]|nr:MAG: cryptochrome/photolyase family protein [Burkholderiales bacterium]